MLAPKGRLELPTAGNIIAFPEAALCIIATSVEPREMTRPHASASPSIHFEQGQPSCEDTQRLDFNNTGLACFMLIDLDRRDARTLEPAGESHGYRNKPHLHSAR
jgi:hypothetical protein